MSEKAKRSLSKKYYSIALGLFILIIVLLIIGENLKICYDSSEGYTCSNFLIINGIYFLVMVFLSILSSVMIIYFIAKKYPQNYFILPSITLLTLMWLLVDWSSWVNFVSWIYPSVGILISLYFIWKE